MKIFLDDMRSPPDGWTLVKTASECIKLLQHNENVTHLSLDHDLGEKENGTGYDVITWIESIRFEVQFAYSNLIISCHSQNPIGYKRIQQVIDRFKRIDSILQKS